MSRADALRTQSFPDLMLPRIGSINSRRQGFALVELIISITIFALAGIAVHTVLSNGISAWRRGNKDKTYFRKVRLVSESIARDLKNTFEFDPIKFEGQEDSVIFPVLILTDNDPDLEQGQTYSQVGRVAYFYDQGRKALCKEEENLPKIYQQEVEVSEGKVLLEAVEKVELTYCYLDNATGSYKWKSDWKKEEQDSIPQALKLKLVFDPEINLVDFEKTIFIPTGTGAQRKELELDSIVE